jgi:hypothetical protein
LNRAGAEGRAGAQPGEAMGWLDIFRRPRSPIADVAALSVFIDEQAAFLVQKGIYEYARARAGPFAKMLFAEQGFLDAIEQARWQAYPLGLAMIGELVEGVLRSHAGDDRRAVQESLAETALAVFDRYPVPAPIGEADWRLARDELGHRLAAVSLHPPKPAMDIPEQFAERYFALMPIHEKLRGRDFPTVRNYLRVTLCNIHEELSRRMNAPALVAGLRADAV